MNDDPELSETEIALLKVMDALKAEIAARIVVDPEYAERLIAELREKLNKD